MADEPNQPNPSEELPRLPGSSDTQAGGDPPPPPEPQQPVEPSAPPAEPPAEAPPTPAPPATDWRDRRIAQLTAQLHAERAKGQARELAGSPPVSEDVNRLVEERAAALAAANEFSRRCNEAAEAGRQAFPDFDQRVGQLTRMVNRDSTEEVTQYNTFLSAALETGNAPQIIHELGGDLNEAGRILSLPPLKMAVEIAKLATRPVQQTSAVPRPINPVATQQSNRSPINPDDPDRADNLSTEEWMKRRSAQAVERGLR